MASSRNFFYKIYNAFERGRLTDEDVLQFCLALLSDYCITETEVEMVQWLQTVGTKHRDMKVNTPKQLLEAWRRQQYDSMVGDAVQRIIDWRKDRKKTANKVLTDTYYLIETYQWGKIHRKDFYKLQANYYRCLVAGREIKAPIPDIQSLLLLERNDPLTLAIASDEVEAAGYEKSAKHLRCKQKHLWTCSVFKGILGTV